MFCTNCGHKLYDDAVFCSYCGIKLHKEENEAAVSVSAPMIKPESQVGPADNENRQVATVEALPDKASEEGVVPVNILVQPVPDSIETKEEEKDTVKIEDNDVRQNIPYENQQYLQQEPEPVAEVKENKKKNIFAFSVLSVLFAVLTIAASVFEMLDVSSELSDVARLIEISITSVILIVFAFLNYRTVSVLKSIALVITMAADIIFIGYSSIEYCVESLIGSMTIERLSSRHGVEEWIVAAFFISMLVWFGMMYIFFIIDAIRGFMGTRGIKTLTLFFGFAAGMAAAANIVFRAVIEDGVTLYYDIIPMNIGYVFLILAICFGIIGKRRLKKQGQD